MQNNPQQYTMCDAFSHTGSMVPIDQELDHLAVAKFISTNKVKHDKMYLVCNSAQFQQQIQPSQLGMIWMSYHVF